MSLKTPRQIVEAGIERDLAGSEPAHSRHKLNALGDFIPSGKILVGSGIAGGFDLLVTEDEGVEGYDFTVAVQDINGQLARYEAGNWCDDRVHVFLSKHHCEKMSQRATRTRNDGGLELRSHL